MSISTCPGTLCESPTEFIKACPTSHELWHRYHRQAESPVENALVEEYLPLVKSVLGRLAIGLPDHADQDDLHSAGLVGLLQALRHYDPCCGSSFETYARKRIRGAMLDELRRMDWVPRAIHEKTRKLQRKMAELEQMHGRAGTDEEIAAAMNLTTEEYNELIDEIRPATFVCLDAVCASENCDSGTYGDLVADPSEESPVELACRNELKEIILRRLKDLPANQRKVLALYYGEDLHLREIAQAMGVTESRVCQIHSQAILSIRAYIQRLENTPALAGKKQ